MLSFSGQSLEDKLYAIKYFVAAQGLLFVVLKATTNELLGPKKKHLQYLVNVSNEPNVSIPHMVKYLMRRAKHQEWSVVFKSLITIHYLMSYGNEKFIQNLASSVANSRSFDYLSTFADRSNSQAYDMSTFLRRYSRYLSNKIHTYRTLGMDFCRTSQVNSKNGQLVTRDLSIDQLIKTLPILQTQFDALLAFDASAKNLCNGIIDAAFSMLYKDFVKLYIAYQAAIIRLLELYFVTSKLKPLKELLEAYKKFLVRMDKVVDFMLVLDAIGMDKSDLPNLTRYPESLSLSSLEKHYNELESRSKRNNQQSSSLDASSNLQMPRLELSLSSVRRRKLRQERYATLDETKTTSETSNCDTEAKEKTEALAG